MPLEITAIASKKGYRVVGQAYGGGKMKLKDWPHPLVVDYAGLTVPPSVPLLINHENHPNAKIGAVAAKREGASFLVDGEIIVQDETGPAAKIVAPLLPPDGQPTTGDISRDWQLSIGAAPQRVEFIPAGHSRVINGTSHEGPFFHVKQSVLREISVVAIGADASTWMRLAATFGGAATDAAPTPDGGNTMPFDAWLKAHGLDGKQFTEAQIAELKAAFDAGGAPPAAFVTPAPVAPAVPDVQATATAPDIQAAAQNAVVAERQRVSAIRAACKGFPQIEAQAIDEGWTMDQTNAALVAALQASRPQAPSIMQRTKAPAGAVIEAAALMSGDIDENAIVASLGEQAVDGARKSFRHGIGIQRMILEAAWANGCDIRAFTDDPRAVMRAAFDETAIRAGFSSISLPDILSNVANKYLLAGFESVEQVWRAISAIKPVKDFKTVTSYRLTGDLEYQEVGPDGELKHGGVDEESFSNQAKTYGRMFSVTRVNIINDDLGALTALPRRIGRGGALKLNKVFWTTFLDNATFFTGARKNYASGAGTALDLDSLTAAEQLFLDQTDPDGNPLAITARVLLVPTALKVKAYQYMISTRLNETTTANKGKGSDNPHAGKWDVQCSAYLSNALIPGHSSAAWYLLASPADLPVIETVFLNGNQSPTVESADADFNTLGIQMRGYHDFGVALQDYRGGVKMAGA